MKGKLIVSPNKIDVTGPVIYLAGPIKGADDWQAKAIDFIQAAAPELHIASPRRAVSHYMNRDFPVEMYNEQVNWEMHYLNRTANCGVILFWLANEAMHNCKRAYAQTTRFELGEWITRHELDGAKLVVGVDSNFSGAKYIDRRLQKSKIKKLSSLEETCLEAIEEAKLFL